jgi:E-phenylitaconyl-CoA hydratase
MNMLLTGEKVSAEYAHGVGLVSRVTPADSVLAEAQVIAARIAANGPLAVQMIKRIASASANLPHAQALEFTELAWGAIRDSQDRIEGRKAFSEKRKPVYLGR